MPSERILFSISKAIREWEKEKEKNKIRFNKLSAINSIDIIWDIQTSELNLILIK